MAEQSPGLIKAVQRIDRFTDTTGVWIAWPNLPLVLAVSYEVIARYLFDAPTITISMTRPSRISVVISRSSPCARAPRRCATRIRS